MGRVVWLLSFALLNAAQVSVTAQAGGRSFTVADDIQLSRFMKPFTDDGTLAAKVSPDGAYFVVVTERGVLGRNVVEDTLWLLPTRAVVAELSGHAGRTASPGTVLARRSAPIGPVITHVRWLTDSSGVAFLAADSSGRHEIATAAVKGKQKRLSAPGQDVTAFDLVDGRVVYTALSPVTKTRRQLANQAAAMVGTGHGVADFLFPVDLYPEMTATLTLCELWSIEEGRRVRIENASSHQPIHLHQSFNTYANGGRNFWLSPNGRWIVALVPVRVVPKAWEEYQRSPEASGRMIRSATQDVEAGSLLEFVGQYALIDLASGGTTQLTDAPVGLQAGYYSAVPAAAWSANSRSVLLSNTYLSMAMARPSERAERAQAPCVAAADVETRSVTCVLKLPARVEEFHRAGIHRIVDVHFAPDGLHAVVDYMPEGEYGGLHDQVRSLWYERGSSGYSIVHAPPVGSVSRTEPVTLQVRETLNEPPVLWATYAAKGVSKAVLDPNPELKDVELGEVTPYKWTDEKQREWIGGLVTPPHWDATKKYPLVLQTHGFEPNQFLSYGAFPSAMAARALAAANIVVLQIGGPKNESAWDGTAEEGEMQVLGYEAAIRQLAAAGWVDERKIGLIGFSRTVFGVMNALTLQKSTFAAATICDGIQANYVEYLFDVDSGGNAASRQFEVMMDARPFGEGLSKWLERSPQFNLDKVEAPLRVEAMGPVSLLFMWAPYAGLRALNKPVDLIVLNSPEHVLTNPAVRMASQGGNVDWFRFWLQGYEDPDRGKAEQYLRWRALRELQSMRSPEVSR